MKWCIRLLAILCALSVPGIGFAQDDVAIVEEPTSSPMRVFGDGALISTQLTSLHGNAPRGFGVVVGLGLSANRMFLVGVQAQGQFVESGKLANFFDLSPYIGVHTPAITVSDHHAVSVGINAGKSYASGERAQLVAVRSGAYVEPTISFFGSEARDAQGTAIVFSLRRYIHPRDFNTAVIVSLRRFF